MNILTSHTLSENLSLEVNKNRARLEQYFSSGQVVFSLKLILGNAMCLYVYVGSDGRHKDTGTPSRAIGKGEK